MASQGLFSIGGIASGLDTSNIIEQLLALERQPVVRLERQQEQLGRVKDAWGQINTKLSSLRAATDKINRVDRFDAFMSVTSSKPDAVSVTTSGTTQTGSLSFTVNQLATRQQRSAAEVFDSRTAALGDRGLSITMDAGGDPHVFDAATLGPNATMSDLVKAVNDAKIGVRASMLQVNAGEFRMVLDADQTGTANTFTAAATGTAWTDGAFTQTQAALDAELTVGGITVTRSSNTITDLVDGATITLKQTTDTAVNVTAQRDVDGAVAAVKGFTDALNGVLSTIADLTKYDAESKEAGLLQGDAAARRLADSLRQSISRPLAGLSGAAGLASSLGISFTRDGTLQVDEAKIRQAFTEDFAGTAARFGRSGTTSDAAGLFLSATSATAPGDFEVRIDTAATVSQVTGAVLFPPGPTEPKTFRITRGSVSAQVTLDTTDTSAAAAVTKINAALREAGMTTLTAAATDDGRLTLSDSRYGTAGAFSVAAVDAGTGTVIDGGTVFGLEGAHAGVDVVGQIRRAGTTEWSTATGAGRTLTGTGGDATGLSVQVTGMPRAGEPDEGLFGLTWTRGVVGQLGSALAQAEGINGIVSRARQAVDRQVEIYQTRIDGFEQRLISREATIRRQFVGMETMLGQLNAQGNLLGQQLAGLNAQMQQ
jgi:flagellar hook-associated protein 2